MKKRVSPVVVVGEPPPLHRAPRSRRKARLPLVVLVSHVYLRRQGMHSQAEEELLHHCGMPSQIKTKQLSYAGRASTTTWRSRMVR